MYVDTILSYFFSKLVEWVYLWSVSKFFKEKKCFKKTSVPPHLLFHNWPLTIDTSLFSLLYLLREIELHQQVGGRTGPRYGSLHFQFKNLLTGQSDLYFIRDKCCHPMLHSGLMEPYFTKILFWNFAMREPEIFLKTCFITEKMAVIYCTRRK